MFPCFLSASFQPLLRSTYRTFLTLCIDPSIDSFPLSPIYLSNFLASSLLSSIYLLTNLPLPIPRYSYLTCLPPYPYCLPPYPLSSALPFAFRRFITPHSSFFFAFLLLGRTSFLLLTSLPPFILSTSLFYLTFIPDFSSSLLFFVYLSHFCYSLLLQSFLYIFFYLRLSLNFFFILVNLEKSSGIYAAIYRAWSNPTKPKNN